MRAVFIGASPATLATVRVLMPRGHEVVIIERDKETIEALAETLDCGILHGDGSRPALLKEADPHSTDFLFCLTNNEQTNIIASLVGRSLGFRRVITRIENPDFEHICLELGLVDIIVPEATVARYLADTMEGRDPLALSAALGGDARMLSFVIGEDDAGPIENLKLPGDSRIVCLYRNDKLVFAETDLELHKGDELVVIGRIDDVDALRERWSRNHAR
ncbi:MAG: TrkA family potassium uptake protein [Chromatiales bacterium]|jgi:trk system potassium uptake protein TrkA|nr:TrkA family potassium uptake protein [Chromatiales bacterium]MDH3894433.1 TrkA family potassium uptake protein [Chromatiales bacterium]MDH3945971.1 TrkA family potassium uptake protein [Chromatiales bacterium]MDH4014534.1 TrkA family potassium uptake protein [Chromatiales bacterium]PLX55203.1 MAG: potassium transporter [Chromatiales bacterium]